jgi:hypothetical protein
LKSGGRDEVRARANGDKGASAKNARHARGSKAYSEPRRRTRDQGEQRRAQRGGDSRANSRHLMNLPTFILVNRQGSQSISHNLALTRNEIFDIGHGFSGHGCPFTEVCLRGSGISLGSLYGVEKRVIMEEAGCVEILSGRARKV